ncbi:MAG: ribonuclease P protein component [Rickettsiaceae bacterium]|nr:ribonuclease P protein component [Rickettsiaceae bacterium]
MTKNPNKNAIISLKNAKEFDIVSKHGSKRYGAYFLVVLASDFTHIPSPESNPLFFGMKVSKKLSKKAVIRNKIKRRIRHLVRNMVNDTSIDTSHKALIIIPKRGIENVEFKKIEDDFCNILSVLRR